MLLHAYTITNVKVFLTVLKKKNVVGNLFIYEWHHRAHTQGRTVPTFRHQDHSPLRDFQNFDHHLLDAETLKVVQRLEEEEDDSLVNHLDRHIKMKEEVGYKFFLH